MPAKLVKVTWDDAEDPDYEKAWLSADDLDEFLTQRALVESCGFLVRENETHILLAADRIQDFNHHGRVTKIPRAVIHSIEEV